MDLADIIHRTPATPWGDGDNIPWNDPDFSRHMLKEHLTQDHDLASRRSEIIDRHVQFIHQQILKGALSTILDLGCGPGLYANRLSQLGHCVDGVDFSPASIEYARDHAGSGQTKAVFGLEDIRSADYGVEKYDLVMLIYGEFNVFRPADAEKILTKAYAALRPGGALLLEPSTPESLRPSQAYQSSWFSSTGGLFLDQPHLVLEETFWEEAEQVVTNRYYVMNTMRSEIIRYASSLKVYGLEQLMQLVGSIGFNRVQTYPSLTGVEDQSAFYVLSARK